jgi:hypothetical protein
MPDSATAPGPSWLGCQLRVRALATPAGVRLFLGPRILDTIR